MTAALHEMKDDQLAKLQRAFRLQIGLLQKAQQDIRRRHTAADAELCELKVRLVRLERGLR